MSKVYITGDVHGDPLRWLASENTKYITENDFVFIAGDFGVLWTDIPDHREKYILEMLDRKPWTTMVVGGNHENWNRLRDLPYEDTPWGRLQRISRRVFFVPNGTIVNIDGRKIFTMGGAESTDKHMRVEDVSWWAGEIATKDEMQFGVDNLDSVDWVVDHIITHTMPKESVNKFVMKYQYHENRAIDPMANYHSFILSQMNAFKSWYAGHFHKNEMFGVVTGLYHNIVDIDTGNVVHYSIIPPFEQFWENE